MSAARRGPPPVLTEQQRADVARVLTRRREIRREIRALEIEFSGLPTNTELVAQYGVTTSTLHNCVTHSYKRVNPLDRATQEHPQ